MHRHPLVSREQDRPYLLRTGNPVHLLPAFRSLGTCMVWDAEMRYARGVAATPPLFGYALSCLWVFFLRVRYPYSGYNVAGANCRCCRSVAAGRVGANRIVLFDSDWNPATDEQARRGGRKRDGWGVVCPCAVEWARVYASASTVVVRGDNSIRAVCFVARSFLGGVFDMPETGGRRPMYS